MSSFKPALIKPTYDVANYGHDITLPLNCLSGSTATLTPSTATFVQVLEDSRVPIDEVDLFIICLLYTSPSPRDRTRSRMPSSA